MYNCSRAWASILRRKDQANWAKDEIVLGQAVSDLLEKFAKKGGKVERVHGIVGHQASSARLADLLSESIVGYTRGDCFSTSSELSEVNGEKSIIFSSDGIDYLPSQKVVICVDVLTLDGSIESTIDAIHGADGIILPFVLVLDNRSGLKEISGKKIASLITR